VKEVESRSASLSVAALALGTMDSAADSDRPGEGTAELLRRARSGEREALEQIIVLEERRVFRTALRLLNYPDDARDAAQEVYLRLYKSLKRIDPNRSLAPWLYRVTVNVCRDLNRKRGRAAALALEDARTGEPAAPGPNPFEEAVRAAERRLIKLALRTLPEKERAAVVLRDLEGLSTAEVAAILGSSEGTVRSQLSTGRLRLKEARERLLQRRRRPGIR
jgi:RNA polymerase sigma-70 factor (ECF subfamily)